MIMHLMLYIVQLQCRPNNFGHIFATVLANKLLEIDDNFLFQATSADSKQKEKEQHKTYLEHLCWLQSVQ